MNDTSQENIYNYSYMLQCLLKDKGKSVADKLAYTDMCMKDKLQFIMAEVYQEIIQNYHDSSCITEDQLCKMVDYVNKYVGKKSFNNNNCNC